MRYKDIGVMQNFIETQGEEKWAVANEFIKAYYPNFEIYEYTELGNKRVKIEVVERISKNEIKRAGVFEISKNEKNVVNAIFFNANGTGFNISPMFCNFVVKREESKNQEPNM